MWGPLSDDPWGSGSTWGGGGGVVGGGGGLSENGHKKDPNVWRGSNTLPLRCLLAGRRSFDENQESLKKTTRPQEERKTRDAGGRTAQRDSAQLGKVTQRTPPMCRQDLHKGTIRQRRERTRGPCHRQYAGRTRVDPGNVTRAHVKKETIVDGWARKKGVKTATENRRV